MPTTKALRFEAPVEGETYAQAILGIRAVAADPGGARRAVYEGVPVLKAMQLTDALGISKRVLAELLAIDLRTVDRYVKEKKRLARAQSDRVASLTDVLDRAVVVLGDRERARAWLHEANAALGGETPLDWLDTEPGSDEVLRLLGRIEHGVFS